MQRTTLTAVAGIGFLAWVLFTSIPPQTTRAQTAAPTLSPGELMMTWRASTYIPPTFAGKALPVPLSTVTVSVEAIRSGRITSLAGQDIRWYVNGRLMGSGAGMQSFSFSIPRNSSGSFDVRVELPNAVVEPAVKTITVPAVRPLAAIVAPFPDNTARGFAAVMRAVPYFFNVTTARDLLFSWTVDDNPTDATENPDQLELSFGGEGLATAEIAAVIRNPLVENEAARTEIDLNFASE